jgi:hypothetical protein
MLLREDDRLYFVKAAENEKAKGFISEISRRDENASKAFGDLAVVVRGELKNEKLYYPYVDHFSLEELVKTALLSDGLLMGRREVEEYVNFIGRIPQVRGVPKEFYETFKIRPDNDGVVTCVEFGCIDCIPGNILVNGNEWYIIDNEWFFEFPVPIDFIIFRGLCSLIINLQDEIVKMRSSGIPCDIFSGYGKKRNWVPITWIDVFDGMEIPLQILSEWNMKFQKKVLKGGRPYRIRLREKRAPCMDTLLHNGKVKNELYNKFNFKELGAFVIDGIGEFIYKKKWR